MPQRGVNLPPTQGSSNAGAFCPGVYQFDYPVETIGEIKYHTVDAVRLLVNAASSSDEECMQKLKGYLEALDGRGVICLFDTIHEDDVGHDSHGRGHINVMSEYVKAWKRIHEMFGGYPQLWYEIFNEPFGYPDVELYLNDMQEVIEKAGLPFERCLIDGLGYAGDVKQVEAAGWPGVVGYHFYPMWLNCPGRTQEGFSNKMQSDLDGLSHKTMITEFGGALNQGDVYQEYHESGEDDFSNVNCLRGIRDAISSFESLQKQVIGLYFWHGWHNGDSYDFWGEANGPGKACVQQILATASSESCFDAGAVCYGIFRLRGSWQQGTAYVTGSCLHWGGRAYELSNVDNTSFQIAGDFGGGSATFTSNEIAWANGQTWTRFEFILSGFWSDSSAQISGSRLFHKGLDPPLYTLSNITAESFEISGGYGGGSATYSADRINWANGAVYKRS